MTVKRETGKQPQATTASQRARTAQPVDTGRAAGWGTSSLEDPIQKLQSRVDELTRPTRASRAQDYERERQADGRVDGDERTFERTHVSTRSPHAAHGVQHGVGSRRGARRGANGTQRARESARARAPAKFNGVVARVATVKYFRNTKRI